MCLLVCFVVDVVLRVLVFRCCGFVCGCGVVVLFCCYVAVCVHCVGCVCRGALSRRCDFVFVVCYLVCVLLLCGVCCLF